ncbi:hypothetical protein KY343_01800, partial [Candidatus Woesearchaeota archaeon]|nr:hypothetical protein [Candidatus Woesearchaeota archaeon]
RKYAEKKIIGLNHDNPDEIKWAKEQSGYILPLAAGIQVGEGYREAFVHGLSHKADRAIIEYLRGKDVEIVPLVREELKVENRAIVFAKGALKHNGVDQLKEDCAYSSYKYEKHMRNKAFFDPAEMFQDKYFFTRAEKAIELIESGVTLDDLEKKLAESDEKIVECMSGKIHAIKPSLVIVHDSFAPKLAEECHGYRLIRSPFVKERKGE